MNIKDILKDFTIIEYVEEKYSINDKIKGHGLEISGICAAFCNKIIFDHSFKKLIEQHTFYYTITPHNNKFNLFSKPFFLHKIIAIKKNYGSSSLRNS